MTLLEDLMFFMRPSEISSFRVWLLGEELVPWVLHPCERWEWKTGKEIICWCLLSRPGNDMFGLSEEPDPLSTYSPLSGLGVWMGSLPVPNICPFSKVNWCSVNNSLPLFTDCFWLCPEPNVEDRTWHWLCSFIFVSIFYYLVCSSWWLGRDN